MLVSSLRAVVAEAVCQEVSYRYVADEHSVSGGWEERLITDRGNRLEVLLKALDCQHGLLNDIRNWRSAERIAETLIS